MDIDRPKKFLLTFALILLALYFGPARALAQQPVTRTIALSWDASPSANVAGYILHFGQQSGSYSRALDVGYRLSAEVPNLIEGTMYYFTVTAYAADGAESDPSEEFHYLPNPAMFLNMSTRATVQSGDSVLISGFIIGGMGEKKVVARVLGPSLGATGIKGTLADPVIELHGPGGLISSNDNWQDGNADELRASNLAPGNSAEAGLVARLKPGSYSVVVRGKKGKTGLVLLEIYDGGN